MGRLEAVAKEYRRLAGSYDTRWARYVAASVHQTLRRLPPDTGGRILDVGCGTGVFLQALTAARPDVRAAGIDLSPEMLAVACGRVPNSVALMAAAADALPFPDSCFDGIVTTNAFHFFRTPREALREFRRVLRPGGVLILTDWCDDYLTCRICDRLLRHVSAAHYRTYGMAGLRELLAHAGFEAAHVERYRISWLWGLMTAVARRN